MLLEYSFFQHALIGGFLASILCGMIGTYIVTRRMVIAGGGMAHASLGGVGLGAYFGFSPIWGASLFALFSGFVIQSFRNKREDAAVAMLWTFGMSIGILFSFLTPGFMTDLPSFLFGDILSINVSNLIFIGILTFFCTLLFIAVPVPVITLSYDRDFAITQGLPVKLLESAMTALTALTIVGCLQMVGIVLVISLLSIPQQTSALFCKTFKGMIFLSIFLGYLGILGGLVISYWVNAPSGACIILLSVLFYALARLLKAIKNKRSS